MPKHQSKLTEAVLKALPLLKHFDNTLASSLSCDSRSHDMDREHRQQMLDVIAAAEAIDNKRGQSDLFDEVLGMCREFNVGYVLRALEDAAYKMEGEQSISTSDPDGSKAMERWKAIGALAVDRLNMPGEMEINHDMPILSEGDSNGTYVLGWAWLDFSDTPFDKEKDA